MSRQWEKLDPDQLTPMMQQYLTQKRAFPDCLLFFRLGDFYELFFDDALIASKELELTLTARDCGLDERAPMCGVPYHAVDGYLNRLIGRGYKVAICDQVEDPATAKGIVRREIVRVVTPGTLTDPANLDERRNHYLAALYPLGKRYGLAVADLSCGTLESTDLSGSQAAERLSAELARWSPAEVLIPSRFAEDTAFAQLRERVGFIVTVRPDDDFTSSESPPNPAMTGHGVNPEDRRQADSRPLWSYAATALTIYLRETQRVQPSHLRPAITYAADGYLSLDPVARRNLEITETIRERSRRGSLLWAIDRTVTSMGGRLLRRWLEQPLLDPQAIDRRLDAVTALLHDFPRRRELHIQLDGLYDLERLAGKVALGSANARDLHALRLALGRLPAVLVQLEGLSDSLLAELTAAIDPLTDLHDLLALAIAEDSPVGLREGRLIREGFDAEIDRLRSAAANGKQWLLDLESRERERTGIRSLKITYSRVFGYTIDVTKANLSLVPDTYRRKQTLANGERFVTDELKQMEDTLVSAEQRLVVLEYERFCQLREQVAERIPALQSNAASLAALDVLAALAEQAERGHYVRPEVDGSLDLEIRGGRHPVVERMLGEGSFIPNDSSLDQDHRLMVLTGPNMSGKSTYLRQNALIVLLAQIGSYVPATAARVGLVDRIFTRIGASDDLAMGQSTFMVEMSEVAAILGQATERSLLILDEIGRGTSTYDGLSIAWAVIEWIADRNRLGARTLFATHYHELTDLAERLPGVFNCHVSVSEENGEVVFLHRIATGGSDNSYGIEVARLAGVPAGVVQRAQEILAGLAVSSQRHKQRVRQNARPLDGQLDLFAVQTALSQSEGILNELLAEDIGQLRPIDALNVLHELQQKARRLKGQGG